MQYRDVKEIKIKYIIEMKDKLIKAKNEVISEEEINEMILDIYMFLINHYDYEYKTNQSYIGFKILFYGYIIKAWTRMNFTESKYIECNKIIVVESIKFYMKC